MPRFSLDSSGKFLRRGFGLGALLLLLCSKLSAQITISGELDTAFYQYSYTAGANNAVSKLSASVKPVLNFDFNTAGDTLLTVTWSAPAGQEIVLTPPTGWSTSLLIYFKTASRRGSDYEDHGIIGTATFANFTGSFTTPVPVNIVFAPDTYYEISAGNLMLTPGTNASFTSFSITYLVPASVNRTYSSVTASDFSMVAAAKLTGAQVANPGTWMTLQPLPSAPIPEPSTYAAIAGLGVLGFVAWRRRRARTA